MVGPNVIVQSKMAEVVREVIADNVLEGNEPRMCVSSRTFTKELLEDKPAAQPSSSSSYFLAEDQSALSREIENWMNGNTAPGSATDPSAVGRRPDLDNWIKGNMVASVSGPTGVNTRGSARAPCVQRSVLARTSSLESNGLWYVLAMVLPLFSSISSCPHWRCSPSQILNSADILMRHVSRVCGRARDQLRYLSQDQVARQIFATAMDVVLVIYAIGFLVLSLYQASIFV